MEKFKKAISLFIIVSLVLLSNAFLIPIDVFAQPTADPEHWYNSYDISWYQGHESDSSYVLSTAEELSGVSYLMYEKTTNFSGKTLSLANDIDLSARFWLPIGRIYEMPISGPPNTLTVRLGFAGTFDGRGHSITGLKIDQAYSETLNLDVRANGFFGVVTSGQIRNLNLSNVLIAGGSTETGGLVGLQTNSSVQPGSVNHCSVTGSVTNTGAASIGGLVGVAMNGSISQSYATATVTNIGSNGYAGGLVGRLDSSAISESYAACVVTGKAPESGGFIGYNGLFQNSVLKSYYDQDLAGQADQVNDGIARTTLDLKKQSTFIDWDFDTVWTIVEDQSYPTFKAVPEDGDEDNSVQESTTKIVREPVKLEPHTVNAPGMTSRLTNDLSYLVAIPEQWMDTTAKVEFWLESWVVVPKTEGFSYIAQAQNTLKSVGANLLDTCQVELMQRVTQKDGTVTEAKVAQEYIRGNFTIRLPIPTNMLKTKDLGIVYIEEDTGLTANLKSKIVTIDGIKYIEFENNRSATYGFISDKNNAAMIG